MSRASNTYIFLPSQNSAVTSLKPHAELLQRDKGAVVAVLSSPPSVLRFEGTGAIHRWLASRPRFGCTHTLYVVAVVVCTSFNAKTRAKVLFLHQVLEYTISLYLQFLEDAPKMQPFFVVFAIFLGDVYLFTQMFKSPETKTGNLTNAFQSVPKKLYITHVIRLEGEYK